MRPAYVLTSFTAACAQETAVWVTRQALEDAAAVFNLHTKAAVLEFISNGGLEAPRHANTAPWQNNPDKSVNIDVDSYDFYSGTVHGYIAFFQNPKTRKWTIKSFKLNDKPGQRFTQMGDALSKLMSGAKK